MYHNTHVEKQKQMFLAVIKWCSRQSGARIVFNADEPCPRANVDERIIYMPTRIALDSVDSTLGTVIHEAMHIKHTPKWLSELPRDSVDKMIFNGLEDCRIETYAVGQLRALTHFLKCIVKKMQEEVEPDKIDLGFKVLCNIACKASGARLFTNYDVATSELANKEMLDNLKESYRRIFTVTMGKSFRANVHELYKNIDEFRKVYNLPKADPTKKEQQIQVKGAGAYGKGQAGDIRGEICKKAGGGLGYNINEQIDLSKINMHLIDINEQAKVRIKETLKKTLTIVIDEGLTLNMDMLPALMTGDIDEIFTDTKTEKQIRTKVYFLVDVSSSMNKDMDCPEAGLIESLERKRSPKRIELACSAFSAIEEIVLELKDTYGMDIDYESFVFADQCKQIKTLKTFNRNNDYVGGGTDIVSAFKTVMERVRMDDPANKRIVLILTDGEIGRDDKAMVELINQEAQDIRVVVTGVEDANKYSPELIKRSINSPMNAEAILIEGFEECL